MKILARLFKRILSFRYKVEIKGLEHLDEKRSHLIMPAHIALVDPILVFAFLREKIRLHPVMTKKYYSNVFLKPFFKILDAVPVEEFEKDQGSGDDAKVMMEKVSEALQQGKNMLLYPQGELARQGYQSIIGKKTAFYACQHAPKETKLITVNIR